MSEPWRFNIPEGKQIEEIHTPGKTTTRVRPDSSPVDGVVALLILAGIALVIGLVLALVALIVWLAKMLVAAVVGAGLGAAAGLGVVTLVWLAMAGARAVCYPIASSTLRLRCSRRLRLLGNKLRALDCKIHSVEVTVRGLPYDDGRVAQQSIDRLATRRSVLQKKRLDVAQAVIDDIADQRDKAEEAKRMVLRNVARFRPATFAKLREASDSELRECEARLEMVTIRFGCKPSVGEERIRSRYPLLFSLS